MNFSKIGVLFSALAIKIGVFAQIQVHEEPLHHPVLSNQFARVLDVKANPGDTSLIHQHSNNYCYVTVSGGKIWVESEGNEGRVVDLNTGFTGGYFENPKQPLIHRFANRADHLIRLIAVENLSPENNIDDAPSIKSTEEVLINNPYFFVTRIQMKAESEFEIDNPNPTVIVNLEKKALRFGKKNRQKNLKTWTWLDTHKKVILKNPFPEEAQVVLMQIKSAN